MTSVNYIIGTGWWCGDEEVREPRRFYGNDVIRSAEFHHLWSTAIDGFTRPQTVFILDSASRRKPPITSVNYRMLSLLENPGHATVHTGQYSGWTASVTHAIEYALASGTDYLVYVEQDALIFGDGIIEFCIGKMKKPLMFGSGVGSPQPCQQSFFIIRRDGMQAFLAGLHSILAKDEVIPPEWKFVLAALKVSGPLPEQPFIHASLRNYIYKLFGWLFESIGYDFLPVNYGRLRPINFDDAYFYFQHGSLHEIAQYVAKLPAPMRASLRERSKYLADLQLNPLIEAAGMKE